MIDQELATAKDVVKIPRAAAELGMESVKLGAQKSPFREEKRPSFSVFERNGRQFFKDFGTDQSGTVFDFVQLARPAWSMREIRSFLLGLAGLENKNRTNRLKTDFRRSAQKWELAQRRRVFALREHEPTPSWSGKMMVRYCQGVAHMDGGQLAAEGRPAAILAEERGWPIQWVDALLNSSKISKPVLPWSAEQSTKRGFALKVEEPFFSTTRKRWELVTVGYHQRFRASHGNAWCYVPHRPKSDKTEEFLEHLKELNRTVPALPFVIGPLNRTRLLVITEGQWDAISLYYAVTRNGSVPPCRAGIDFADDPTVGPMVSMGLRGAASVDAFLSAWQTWLRSTRPNVLIVRDNDESGAAWAETLPARLRDLGCQKVVLTHYGDGKDFNDYWIAESPTAGQMVGWFEDLHLLQ